MRLLSIEMQLFRQHASTALQIPDGLIGIVGSNGSGKTTLMESIAFALFGSKALRGKVEDVRTRSAIIQKTDEFRAEEGSERVSKRGSPKRRQDAEPKVTLTLDQDGVVFRIERTLTDALLFVGGEAQPVASGNKEVTTKISSIIGMTHDEFVATYFTEQKGLEFLSGKKGATEREKFIVRMMGYDRLEEMQVMLRDDRKEKRAILSGYEASVGTRNELEERLTVEEADRVVCQEKHDEAARALKKAEHNLEFQQLRLAKLEEVRGSYLKQYDVVHSLGIRLDEKSKRAASIREGIDTVTLELEAFSKATGATHGIAELELSLTHQLKEFQERSHILQSKIREGEILWREGISAAEAELTAILKSNEILERRLAQIRKLKSNGECPTCGQPLAESFEKTQLHFKEELAQGEIKIKELQVRISERKVLPVEVIDLVNQLKVVEEERNLVAGRLAELAQGKRLHERVLQLQAEQSALKKDIIVMEKSLDVARDALKAIRFSEEEYTQVKSSHDVTQRVVEVARLQRLKIEGEVNMKSALVTRTRDEIKKFDERQTELERLRKEVRLLDEGDRILTEFRKHINSLIRPRLAELASEYLADLTDSRYTALELGDDFSPTVLEDGEPKPIISGGEQDILNLCMRLALSHMLAERAGQQFSLLILDEIFGSLDENRRGNVLSLLDKLRKRFEQILVITHLDDVKEGVQRLIQVEYDEATGASRVYDSSDAEWYGEVASNF
jgi:exonuclease SbcC